MPTYSWIACGSAAFRIEFLGQIQTIQPVDDSGGLAVHSLSSVAAIRVRNLADPNLGARDHVVIEVPIEEITLDAALPLKNVSVGSEDRLLLQAIPGGSVVLEGLEGAEERFLDLVDLSGWKLILEALPSGAMRARFYLVGDWGFDTHPDYFPGSPFGEVSFVSEFGGAFESALEAEIPWPFARDARLPLGAPTRPDGAWSVPIRVGALASIFDAAGPALKDLLIGSISVRALAEARLEAGVNEGGSPFFRVSLAIFGSVPLLELAGQQLSPGQSELRLTGTLNGGHISLGIDLILTKSPALTLVSPFVVMSGSPATPVREVAALLPPSLAGEFDALVPPSFTIAMAVPPGTSLRLANVDIPTRWDSVPLVHPSDEQAFQKLAEGLTGLDASKLIGYSFGALSGDAPRVQLQIRGATSDAAGIVFTVMLTVQTSSSARDSFTLIGTWRFRLDPRRLALVPASSIYFSGDDISVMGLTIAGLRSLGVSWEGGNLSLSATGLRAFFTRLSDRSDPSDPSRGFEFDISVLRIDSGGLDLEMTLAGGVTKIQGIGEAFKGTRGSVSIVDSKLMTGSLSAEGPLPHLDNATGSITVLFKDGLHLAEARAEFQLGLHRRVDWWLELDLKSVRLEIANAPAPAEAGDVSLILMITGGVAFKPAAGSTAIAAYLREAKLDFKDLVLTKAFHAVPPGISLSVELARPMTISILEAFVFEMRSVGIGRGADPGQGALNIGGQIFFSAGDLVEVRPDYHIFRLQKPSLGSLLPRVTLEHLQFRLEYKPTVKVEGFVALFDTAERRGFVGGGSIVLGESINLAVLLEFSAVRRPSDGADLRVWMVYAEVRDANVSFLGDFFIRDFGVGFGLRKTLAVMDQPSAYINTPSQGSLTFSPHLPSAWVDDLDGEEARWTMVLSAWLTQGLQSRHQTAPLVADILLGLRSDLTFFLGVRGWVFSSLEGLRTSSRGARPSVVGLIYYSMRNRHLLASVVTNPAAAAPEGIPEALIEALGATPFNFTLETRPGLFRLELGWPRQLTLRLGVWTGWAGMLLRAASGALTIGLGFEIGLSFGSSTGLNFGIFGFSISAYGQISVFGEILARIGDSPALFGSVGVNAIAILRISAWINIKLGFFRLRMSFSYAFELIITARVSFGIAAGFGLEGYASVSLRVWKFSVGGSVSLSINKGALDEAARRVYEGTSMAGGAPRLPEKKRVLPAPSGLLPALRPERPRWTVFHVQRDGRVYVLLLPSDDTWFATPPAQVAPAAPGDAGSKLEFPASPDPDYEIGLRLDGIELVRHLGNPERTGSVTGDLNIAYRCKWNTEIPGDEAGRLGEMFFEEPVVHDELQLLEAILSHPDYRPELLIDRRARAEKGSEDGAGSEGVRPDVRSPQFSHDDGFYDLALREAFGYAEDDTLSWERIALGMTVWAESSAGGPFGDYVERAFRRDDTEAEEGVSPKAQSPVERRYATLEQLRRNRSGLLTRLLHEFRGWALGLSEHPIPLLTASGLAFEFAPKKEGWLLEVTSLSIQRAYSGQSRAPARPGVGVRPAIQRLVADGAETQLRHARIRPSTGGLGFRRAGVQYRIRDILELQDRNGIHFSWLLECIDAQGRARVMSPEELSGLATNDGSFEYFDHYSVVRSNLSQQAREGEQGASVEERKVRPGFIPSFVDLGAGLTRFFLVAPRFELSDLFATPAAVGDLLLYRFAAVDVFGNRSQTIEYLTYRKQLEPPPPPDSALASYSAALSRLTAEEQITVSVRPAGGAAGWVGGEVIYEVWVRPLPLAQGGYYGLGDDAGEVLGQGRPSVEPRGMMRVGSVTAEKPEITLHDLQAFRYGTLFEFHVRAVSADGNASRLVRCHHVTHLRAGARTLPERPQAYLERIPAPGDSAESSDILAHVALSDMRAELQTATEPRPSLDADKLFERVELSDLSQRELTLRILHHPYTDGAQRHLTGGYRVFTRDRDAGTPDQPAAFKLLADIEVIGAERYRLTPPRSEPWPKWHGRYLREAEASAFAVHTASGDGEALAWLDFGADEVQASMDSSGLLPEGARLHVLLSEILAALKERAAHRGYRVEIVQGGPSQEELAKLTYRALLENHAEAKDPYGSGLLKWLGRSVDLTLVNETGTLPARDLFELLTAIVREFRAVERGDEPSRQQVVLEVMVNGDRRSPMGFHRVSLLPRLRRLPAPDANPGPLEARRQGLRTFVQALTRAFGASLPGLLDATLESYETLTRRFLRQRPLLDGEPPPVALGVAFYEEGGSFSRPLDADDTIAIQIYYVEQYARRFAYRVERVSRYFPLYRELGIQVDKPAPQETESPSLLVRLPRVKPPAPPAARFLGSFLRDEIPCSEWIIEAHDEEALVQSNETLRNRLGYRGVAWSLFSEVMPNWDVWSGWRRPDAPTAAWLKWTGNQTWTDRPAQVDDGGPPGPSATETALLRADAAWAEPSPALPRSAGLAGHPFTGLLLPKGLSVRIPKLPYYYRYRLGVFARTDDVDSPLRLVDASPVFPSRVPTVDPASAGWRVGPGGLLEIWWRVPSVWDSLDDVDRALWINERPLATRLWDFDLRYTLLIRRFKGDPLFETVTPLLVVESVPPDPAASTPVQIPSFMARTTAGSLYFRAPGKIEERTLTLASPFMPRLSLSEGSGAGAASLALGMSDTFKHLAAEFDFVIELHCSRAYGPSGSTVTSLSRVASEEPIS
ncbi:MAG: hypothetical protein IPK82_27510 [Polyangiaceae bacterium]|nr:hypothetical protein [Polyangiaceae bacterium]